MKKLQVAFAALVLTSTFSFAQPTDTQNRKAPGRHQHQNKLQELNLTEDQKTQMKTANDEFKAQLKSLNSNENQTVKQQKDQRAALIQAHQAKLQKILTPEQQSKMTEIKATEKQNYAAMSGGHLQNLQRELNLTDAQANELKSSEAALKSKLDAIRNDPNLDETAKRQQLTGLKNERKAMFDKVLTAEQKQKFQGMKEHKGKIRQHKGRKNSIPANV